MAKLNVTVDNGLDEVKLVKSEELESKKNKKKAVEKKQKPKKETTKKGKEGYLKQVSNEMKLVTWPSKKNLFKYSIATILLIIVLALFFIGLTALFDLLYGLVQGWIG